MATDREVILNALQRERNELHDRIMQIDRILKRVRDMNDINNDEIQIPQTPLELKVAPTQKTITASKFTRTADIKLQVLNVFDVIGKASKLKQLQATYFKLSDNAFSIREIIRGLNRQGLLLKMRERDTEKSVLWVKREWVVNGQLLDERKPEGFDMLFNGVEFMFE